MKKDLLPSADQKTTATSSSSTATDKPKTPKKSSGSSRRASSAAKKKEPWKGYDFDSMPELTEAKIRSLRRVSKSEHKQLSLAVKRHVGRPRKPEAEKEELVSIRFSANFLQRLKEKARQEGYTAWQTYAKKVLAEHVK